MSLTCKFYGGNTGATFSKIWGRNITLTEEDVSSNYVTSWSNETYLLASFNNNLDAGSIDTSIGEITNWLLYREEQGQGTLQLLGSLDNLQTEFYDFKNLGTNIYKYYLFAVGTLALSNPTITQPVQSDYYGWFLIDPEYNKSYQFDINFDGGTKNYTEDYTEYEPNNLNNIFTRGSNFFLNGSISGIISTDNLKKDAQYTNADLLSLSEFINSDRVKYLKSIRGEIFKVLVYGYQQNLLNSALGENIYTTSFNFKEVGEV